MAKSIGVKTIGVINKFQERADFKDAELLVNNIKDLNISDILK